MTTYRSILEKENINFKSNGFECSKIKYGSFTNGTDTIVRFIEKGKNYELTKSLGIETLMRIKWMDSCSYVKLNSNNSVYEYIRLGNFESEQHYIHSKPGDYHSITDESYEMIIKIIKPSQHTSFHAVP